MRREPVTPPPSWRMEVFEVVPRLFIATRLGAGTEYRTLGVDAIIDLEDWEDAWTPPVPAGGLYVCLPMDDGDEVDPKVPELAAFHRLARDVRTTGPGALHGGAQSVRRRRGARPHGHGHDGWRGDRPGSPTERTQCRWVPGSEQSGLRRVVASRRSRDAVRVRRQVRLFPTRPADRSCRPVGPSSRDGSTRVLLDRTGASPSLRS